ncbi:hypothetical protein K5E_21980 [Enterococcus thailandicus]|uniref:hypothetical protein n=1 Tax=Enterococcus thailandicus TaxID=417368 RepID=UPI00244D84D0|nr:hypothetical protein [Enterococcus thailandicus]GMC02533.1 hypothetical protein K4E_00430 [Enterococcus thailandicus]GMC10059.1 hypothetical protein K5E_21980 [Enterococcus thailandicus]
MEMKFFEIGEPNLAIVIAKDKNDCMEFYNQNVLEIGDKASFFASLKEIEMTIAITRLANAGTELFPYEPVGFEEAAQQVFHCINNKDTTLLAVEEDRLLKIGYLPK